MVLNEASDILYIIDIQIDDGNGEQWSKLLK
jgi:hypothetical protein